MSGAFGIESDSRGSRLTSRGKAEKAERAYIDAAETLRQAGHLMRELGIGALDVRGENGEIRATISRDMVVQRIAAGGDPRTVTVGEVARAVPARRRAAPRSGRTPRPTAAARPTAAGRAAAVARPSGAGGGPDDHGPDPGDYRADWAEAEPDRVWPRPALTTRDSAGRDEITTRSTALVA